MSVLARLWTLRERHPLFVALAVVLLFILLAQPLVERHARQLEWTIGFTFHDFGAYSVAVDHWLEGEAIYQEQEDGSYHGSYLYPPVALLFLYPFSQWFGSFDAGAAAFGLTQIGLLWLGLQAVISVLGYRLEIYERVLFLGGIVAFQPALLDFKIGQISTLLAALLCFAFYAHERGHARKAATGGDEDHHRLARLASGALTTMGSTVKLFYATSGAHLLRNRDRFVGAMLGGIGLVVLSFAVFGIDAHRGYLDVLTWGKGWGPGPVTPQIGTVAYYRPLYELGDWAVPAQILGVFVIIGLTLWTRGAPVSRETFALGVAAIPLLAPRAYTQDLVVLLLPAVILLAVELDRPSGRPDIPVLAVLLLHFHAYGREAILALPDWLPLAELAVTHLGWLQPGLWGTLLLVGLAAKRVADGARPADTSAADRTRESGAESEAEPDTRGSSEVESAPRAENEG